MALPIPVTGIAIRIQQSLDGLGVQVMTGGVCRKDGRSWMYDPSQSIKRCSILIMKQLFAACFDSDAVSLHSDSVARNVHSHQKAAACLSIL